MVVFLQKLCRGETKPPGAQKASGGGCCASTVCYARPVPPLSPNAPHMGTQSRTRMLPGR
jgi:hypothetical protein